MRAQTAGFTLIELVITMTVSVVVVSFVAVFISGPVAGFTDQARRARLVDAADATLSRMSRDIRRALPNSVRITSNGAIVALELLSSVDGARYRDAPPGGPARQLDFSAADGSFNSVGRFTQVARPFSSTSHYLAIYNVGVPGANAYELVNVITPPGTRIDIDADSLPGEDRVTLSPAFDFAYQSPRQRMFLIDSPITYLCDPVGETLTRYSGYAISLDQSSRDSDAELTAAGAGSALMADHLSSCAFSYAPGTSERAGLVSIAVAVSEQGETVSLLKQIHVDNVP